MPENRPTPTASIRSIPVLSAPRVRPADAAKPRRSYAAKKDRAAASADRRSRLNAAISDLLADISARTKEIAEEFDMKPRWVQDQIYYGGQHVLTKRDGNAYNAFIHFKNQALADEGEQTTHGIVDLANRYSDEYASLTAAEKEDLVRRHQEEKE
ncbi:hypothetical protein FISHEDRAFT_76707, partial [Fistulina hepatica ATCC 64428]